MVTIQLADDRSVSASLEHPILGDRVVGDLGVGDAYDGSVIRAIHVADYTRSHTYDIRVSGDTGIYWANGVPVTSTLRARD